MKRYTRKRKYKKRNSKKHRGGNKETYTAFIIEPREHRALSFVVKNALENLDSNWNVRVYHGNLNKKFVENLLETDWKPFQQRISLESLGVDNFTEDWKGSVSYLLLNPTFIEKIPTETFLIFQTDSMINPNCKDLINKFLEYDYVGAPWKTEYQKDNLDTYSKNQNLNKPYVYDYIGNGGFSLRKKSKMLEIVNSLSEIKEIAEDIVFSVGSNTVKARKPPFDLAKEFAIEMIYVPRSFGVHKPWLWLSQDELNQLKNDCPGLQTLIDLQ
jgi:hypothetical protein